jgi:hypothetical protein
MKKMSRIEVVVIPMMMLMAIIALPMYVLTVISP